MKAILLVGDEEDPPAPTTENTAFRRWCCREIWRAAGAWRSRIESGMCQVNGPTAHDEAQMPFGGVKGSGYGRFGGRAGIEAFTELRWISLQTAPRHYPF